jgi:F-type H+-transporting ATPase subunit b
MNLISPNPGLFLWVLVAFLLLFLLLRKFAWPAIIEGLAEREESIKDALLSAEKARNEMANMQADNIRLLNEAKEEKNAIITEARTMKDTIINDAKEKAKTEANKIVEDARLQIHNEKMAALTDVKNQIGKLSLEVAEKVLRRKLADNAEHTSYVNTLTQEIKLN